jgi:hypothetical protein
LVLVFFGIIPSLATGTPVTLSNVPAYDWYHGCGPTAAGSIIGYWDLHGYPNLFTASGSSVFLTANVQDQISSPEHNAKYDPTPDNPSLPIPPMTSIADWFRTSVDPLGYGSSYLSYAPDAFTGYTHYRGYTFSAWNETFGTEFKWSDLTSEIKAGRPLMFLVDSNGDGQTDHFVPVFGYDDRGTGGLWYGLYTTWSESEVTVWEQFRGMSSGYDWGVGYATLVDPVSAPVPEPTTMLLLGSGLLGMVFRGENSKS